MPLQFGGHGVSSLCFTGKASAQTVDSVNPIDFCIWPKLFENLPEPRMRKIVFSTVFSR
jgi:hypothetical protein